MELVFILSLTVFICWIVLPSVAKLGQGLLATMSELVKHASDTGAWDGAGLNDCTQNLLINLICLRYGFSVEQQYSKLVTYHQTKYYDTPRRPMITHTGDSHQIPIKKKTKLQIFKKLPKIQILKFCTELYTRYTFCSCLICRNMKWIQQEL